MTINLRKLDRMELLAFLNGLRLHRDAILLYTEKRYPSAFYLSVLSQEEFGKAEMIGLFVFHSRIDGRATPKQEEKWLQLLYRHPLKQSSFLRHSPSMDWSSTFVKLMQEIADGKLEQDKQSAVYVGLKRDNKRKIDINGSIRHPFKVTVEKAEKQITKINDSLVDLCMGVIHDYYIVDNEKIEKITNKKLLAELERNWKKKSPKALARIKSIEKQLAKPKTSI